MIAHADTVHPVGTLAEQAPDPPRGRQVLRPRHLRHEGRHGDRARRPEGRRSTAGKLNLPVTIIINPDEEIGSPTSRAADRGGGQRHKYVLIPEPAKGERGEVTTGRHAFQRFFLTTHGRPAHSGWTNKDGRSAVRVMAQIVEELESRSDFDKGPTYAVSVFHGGQWVNCVPMTCTAQALCVSRDCRHLRRDRPGDGRPRRRALGRAHRGRARAGAATVDGACRQPWRSTSAPGALPATSASICGHGQHGGGSDGNFTGAMGVATLDGLGVMGGGAHTHEEHILVSSLVPRATLLARLIAELD